MFLELLGKSRGIVKTAREALDIPRRRYERWMQEDEEFADAVHDIIEDQIDLVENSLIKRIEGGDTTAIIFYLKTKGKNRGYSEKATPDPRPLPQTAESKELVKVAKKKVKSKKDYIIRLLKKEGKYTAELSMQVTLAAQLMVKAEQIQEEMQSPEYQQVLVEYSREGNRREQINPKEKLFMDLSGQIQKALRALGMNTDSKERKTDGDDLGDFMKALEMKEDTP